MTTPYAPGFDEWLEENYDPDQEEFNLADMRLLYDEKEREIRKLREFIGDACEIIIKDHPKKCCCIYCQTMEKPKGMK